MSAHRPSLKDKQRVAKKPKFLEEPKIKPALKSSLKKPSTSQTSPISKVAPKPTPKVVAKSAPKLSAPKALLNSAKAVSLKDLKDKKGKATATQPDDEPTTLPSTFKIITGTYEKLLYGLEGTVTVEGSSHQFHLKPIFIFPAHISSLKAVAASPYGGKWLATGSSDEIIKVWDLRRRKEIGGLMHHEGTYTNLVLS
jgi:protein MAK11